MPTRCASAFPCVGTKQACFYSETECCLELGGGLKGTQFVIMSSVKLLTLEGPEVEKGSWRNRRAEELIDALPYFDKEYEDPQYKDEVQRLIQEEMKRSVKKPASFLADLPVAPVANFAVRMGLQDRV